MKLIRTYFFFFIFIIAAGSAVWAKGEAGTKAAQFITLGVGGRALGMSGAYVAVDGDIFSTHWNPAGLALINAPAVGFMHNTLPADITREFVVFGLPVLKEKSFAAITFNMGKYGSEARTTYLNNYGTGDSFDGSDIAVVLSYASKADFIDRRLRLGVNLKYIKQEIYNHNASAIAIDIGGLYRFTDNFSLGANISNIGGKIKFIQEAEELPLQLRGGAAFNIMNMVNANCDMLYTKDEKFDFAIGVELRLIKSFALRTGLNSINNTDDGFTFGFGLNFDRLNLDYAYEPYGVFDASHKMTIDYTFGKTEHKSKQIKPLVDKSITNRMIPAKKTVDHNAINEMIKNGYAENLKGNYSEAIKYFEEALKYDEFNIQARLWLAYTYSQIGDRAKAINEYEKVLKIEPYNVNAIQALKIIR